MGLRSASSLRLKIPVGVAGQRIPARRLPPGRPTGETSRVEGAAVEYGRPSIGLWIPIIWYGIEATRSISRWLSLVGYQVAQTDPLEGTPIDRAIFAVLMVMAMAILAARKVKVVDLVRHNWSLSLLFLFMLISVGWSDFPEVSVKRWIRALIDLLMALVVLTDRRALDAECALIRRVMFIVLPVSIVLIKYFRTIGTDWDELGMEMWVGATTHKNVLGEVAMTGAILFLFEALRRKWRVRSLVVLGPCFLMAGWILRGSPSSRSNTAILGFAIGACLLIGLHLLRSRAHHIRRYVVAAAAALTLLFGGLQFAQAVSDQSIVAASIAASGRDVTLTGRTDLWSDLWTIASEHPFLGVGYGAFWIGNTHNLWAKHLWHPAQGHNGYLDVFLELGAVGFLLLLLVIVASFRTMLRELPSRFDQTSLHLVWLAVILCHNFTESSFLRGQTDLWFVVFLPSTVSVPMANVTARPRDIAPRHRRQPFLKLT